VRGPLPCANIFQSVVLSASPVIPILRSRERNLRFSLRVNSAKERDCLLKAPAEILPSLHSGPPAASLDDRFG